MIKRLLHKILGYKIEITFPDGNKKIARAYLSADCTVRATLWGTAHCYLQSNGIIRGLWPNDKTTWKAL